MSGQLIFEFKPEFNSRFQLDGAFYTVLSTKPMLSTDKIYVAKYIKKELNSIHAVIIGKNGHPAVHAIIETR